MNLDKLFPNSPDKCIARLEAGPLTDDQAEALDHLKPVVIEAMRDRAPITISLGKMSESNGRVTYMAFIRRGDAYIESDHTSIKGPAEYAVARWKHVLLGHPEPDILAFNTEFER